MKKLILSLAVCMAFTIPCFAQLSTKTSTITSNGLVKDVFERCDGSKVIVISDSSGCVISWTEIDAEGRITFFHP